MVAFLFNLHWPLAQVNLHADGLVQDCNISIANTLEIVQTLH